MATGAALVGGFVTWLGSGTIAAGIVSGALVGAAIGGLTAAVAGGDILKGVLFGAVGGAVTGGVGAWASGGGGAGGAAGSAGSMTPALLNQSVSGGAFIGSTGTATASSTATTATTSTISGKLASAGMYMAKEFGDDLVLGLADAYMKGDSASEDHKNLVELTNLKHKNAMEYADKYGTATSTSGGAPDHAIQLKEMDIGQRNVELAEATRKYELDRSDRLKSEEEIKTAKAGRQGLYSVTKKRKEAAYVPDQGSVQEMRANEALASTAKTIIPGQEDNTVEEEEKMEALG